MRQLWTEALKVLVRMRESEVIDLVVTIVKCKDNYRWQNWHCRSVMNLLGHTRMCNQDVIEALEGAVGAEDSKIRINSAKALVRLRRTSGLRTIVEKVEFCEFYEGATKLLKLIEGVLRFSAKNAATDDLRRVAALKKLTKIHAISGGPYDVCTRYKINVDCDKVYCLASTELAHRGFDDS